MLSVPLLAGDPAVSSEMLQLVGHATLTSLIQRGGLTLIYGGQPIQRMNIFPDHPHANGFRKDVPNALRGARLPAGQSRLYRWEWNRRWPREAASEIGWVLEPPAPDFDAAVGYFLTACAIIGEVPSPPYTPRLFP